jgi:hypothetical protein
MARISAPHQAESSAFRSIWISAASAILLAAACVGPALASDAQSVCAAKLFRSLDFRIGSFKGVTATGQDAGTTEVAPAAEGCALLEHWQGAMGGNGVGLFFYHRAQEKWQFNYANADGEILILVGTADANGVTFTGENRFYSFQGLHQMRWERAPNGAVRQIWKLSVDKGQTWQPIVDMVLIPKS